MARRFSGEMPDDVVELLNSNLSKEEKMEAARKGNMPMPVYCRVPECGVELTQDNSNLPESHGRHDEYCPCLRGEPMRIYDDGSVMHSFSTPFPGVKVCNQCLETTDATDLTCTQCFCVLYTGSYSERGDWPLCEKCFESIEERCGPLIPNLECPSCKEIGELKSLEGNRGCSNCECEYMNCIKCETVTKLISMTWYCRQTEDDVAGKVRFWAALSSIGEGKDPIPEKDIEDEITRMSARPLLDENEIERILSEYPRCEKSENGAGIWVPDDLTEEIGITMDMSPAAHWATRCEKCGTSSNWDLHWDEGG